MAMRRPIGLALENEEVMATGTEVVDTEAVEVVEEVQEVAEQAEEVSGDVAQVEEAEADVAVVEQIEEVLEKAVESGEGISETAAEIAQIAVESMQRRLGIKAAKMPSLESFGSASSRVTATRVALEGIKDTAKKAWAAIVNFVKSIAEKIKTFFKGLFDTNTRLLNRAEKIKARASETKGTPEGKVDAKAVFAGFRGDKGNVATYLANATELVSGSEKVAKSLTNALSTSNDLDKEAAAKAMTSIKSVQPSSEVLKKAGISDEQKGDAFMMAEMFGGANLVVVAPTDGKVFVKVVTGEEMKADKPEMDVLTTSEVSSVCDQVKATVTAVTRMKDIVPAFDKAVKAIDALAKKQENDDPSTRAVVLSTVKAMNMLATQAGALAVRTAGAALNYAEASLAKHKAA